MRFGIGVCTALLTVVCGGLAEPQTHSQTRPEVRHNAASTQYKITGIVLNSVDGSTVSHCRLTPTLIVHGALGGRRFPASASADSFEADDHGRFSVSLPSAGAWNLRASARGYVSHSYDEHGAFASAVVVTAEAPTIDLRFKLSPEATIAGVVLDEAGEPVRDAQIALHWVPPVTPGGPQPQGGTRATGRTDDRGMYELANLSPGSYRLTVQAHPWYAAALQRGGITSEGPQLDPSLDFAYPLTWFPGSSDVATAETIVLHAGDTRQADFHLVPIASIHMRIVPPLRSGDGTNDRQGQGFPIVQQVTSGPGGGGFVSFTSHQDAQGQFDIGGLTPGLYQVRVATPNQEGHSALVEVTANSARTVDLSAPSHDVVRVTIHFDGVSEEEDGPEGGRGGGLRVSLIDMDTHRGSFSSNGNDGGFAGRRGQRNSHEDQVVEAPPGRYEVVVQGRQNIYLTGLSAKGAEASGRYVIVPAGDSTLTVHVASGRASLTGIATIKGKPAVGAMVLLVPITIEEADSIPFLRQDQTNTDGSFEVENLIPGQYILVAIDHGWEINWGDPSTLRRYLAQGVPMEIKSSASVKQDVKAQAP